jgi:hypothetical protein
VPPAYTQDFSTPSHPSPRNRAHRRIHVPLLGAPLALAVHAVSAGARAQPATSLPKASRVGGWRTTPGCSLRSHVSPHSRPCSARAWRRGSTPPPWREFHALLKDPFVPKPVEQGAAHEADHCILSRRCQDVQDVGGITKVQVTE